ncbi:hypothetical protein RIF29_20986 [Crotalaria pallida]|uniref:Uncharacterized protein n=1 Tax=Crotalaria pallida TaxID=3830 RepID=A0AAN9F287_CROPI
MQHSRKFLELHAPVYSRLVRQFYANLTYIDDVHQTMVNDQHFTVTPLDFHQIAGLQAEGSFIGDPSDPWWKCNTDNVYTACLRENAKWEGRCKRAGSMKVEARLILYLLSYCLIPRSTGNHAQPTELDLKYINGLKLCHFNELVEGTLIGYSNRFVEVLAQSS